MFAIYKKWYKCIRTFNWHYFWFIIFLLSLNSVGLLTTYKRISVAESDIYLKICWPITNYYCPTIYTSMAKIIKCNYTNTKFSNISAKNSNKLNWDVFSKLSSFENIYNRWKTVHVICTLSGSMSPSLIMIVTKWKAVEKTHHYLSQIPFPLAHPTVHLSTVGVMFLKLMADSSC